MENIVKIGKKQRHVKIPDGYVRVTEGAWTEVEEGEDYNSNWACPANEFDALVRKE